MKPQVENAPGIVWRQSKNGQWEAMWRARTDIVKKGFEPKNHHLWSGLELSEAEAAQISDTCRRLQDEMLLFARGGLPAMNVFDGTLRSLIYAYQTDPDSTYHKKRYGVRVNHDQFLKRIALRHGSEMLSDIKARLVLVWHKEWSDDGVKVAIAHAFIGHLRTLFGFGATILEDPDCERLCGVLHKMRFPMAKPRTEHLSAEQVIAHRAAAHVRGWGTMALADAFQFEGTLRQKDVIGEWVPLNEPGISDTIRPDKQIKWITGLRFEEIDENLILKHVTSKRSKEIIIDLRLAPMVLEELALDTRTLPGPLTRASLPAAGPIIICEVTGFPYLSVEFRRKWRLMADKAGLPKTVRSMDARAGAISEAVRSGAKLELIRHAATHSDIGMTQRYDREAASATASVMRTRVEGRNKPKT
jgi:hypothetical protein